MRPFLALSIALTSVALAGPAFADLGPPRPSYEVERGQLILPAYMSIVFKHGTDELEPKSLRAIGRIAAFLDEKEGVTTMRVASHVDTAEAGTAVAAQTLSEKRALVVAKAIADKGIACARLLPVGFGDTKAVAPVRSPANSRVEAHIAGSKSRPIGGAPMDGGGKVAGDPCQE